MGIMPSYNEENKDRRQNRQERRLAMTKNKLVNQGAVRRVYRQIILLGMLVHVLYVALFGGLGMSGMVYYNVGSTVFYMAMLVLVFYGRYRMAVTLIHLEVCVFVTAGTFALGCDAGLPLLLIALASLIYIRPYRRSWIPYMFSALEIGVFVFLKIAWDQEGMTPVISACLANAVYLFNAAASFTIILVSSTIFNVSSALAQGRLMRKNEILQEAASTDSLTGVLTRYGLKEQLELLQGKQAVIALGDLDDFKRINDTYGHICGKMPRGLCRYFCVVTREMVDSCISTAWAMSASTIGFINSSPCSKKACCCSTMQRLTRSRVSLRLSRLLINHFASCKLLRMYWLSASLRPPLHMAA